MKKFLSLALTLMLVLSSSMATSAANSNSDNAFTDVTKGAWYYNAVNEMVEKGILHGVGNNKFAPSTTTTRAMFAQILFNLTENKTTNDFGVQRFIDNPKGKWYHKAVQWAGVNAISEGTSPITYSPQSNLTREQAVKLLYVYMTATKNSLGACSGSTDKFQDAKRISSWAKEAMDWAVGTGIIEGIGNNRLDPRGWLTRAQAAQILRNVYPLIINRTVAVDPSSPDLSAGPADGILREHVGSDVLFTYTLPASLKENYLLQTNAGSAAGFPNYTIYDRITKVRTGEGRVFGFWVSPKGTVEQAQKLLKISDVACGGNQYTIYLYTPTDVQFLEMDTESRASYEALSNGIQGVLDSIQYAPGVTIIN